MTLLSTVYTSEAELQRLLSSYGVLSYADHDEDGTAETGVVDDCINQATEEIDLYARQRYSQAGLASSSLVARWATTIAAYFLSMRRANPIPESLESEFQRLLDPRDGLLAKVAAGKMQIPGLALKADLSPTFSNLKVDRRYSQSTIRVTRNNSSDAPSVLSQDSSNDYPAEG